MIILGRPDDTATAAITTAVLIALAEVPGSGRSSGSLTP